jgi:hypothetical protein
MTVHLEKYLPGYDKGIDQIARQTSPFRAGRIARVAKPPYVRSAD